LILVAFDFVLDVTLLLLDIL
jgi:hypothetical protein